MERHKKADQKKAPAREHTSRESPQHCQESLLRAMRGRRVAVRLLDGAPIEGVLVTHDRFCLALRADDALPGADGSPALPCLLFKHAIVGIDWAGDAGG